MRAIFLDRDGVINENQDEYVKDWGEFHFLSGALAGLRELTHAGYRLIVVTNQSPINRGVLSAEKVEQINARMVAEIAREGGRIEAVFYCPHRPDENCDCRKPRPGLLFRAARELGLDLASAYMIGDYISDVEAARAAGCQPVLVLSGRGGEALVNDPPPDVLVANNLLEAARLIIQHDWQAPCKTGDGGI